MGIETMKELEEESRLKGMGWDSQKKKSSPDRTAIL